MLAGRLRYRVTLWSRTTTQDAYGQPIITWTSIADVWASIDPLSGREYLAAGGEQSEIAVKISLRHRDDVQPGWRITHGDELYDVQAVLPHARRTGMTLMCRAGATDGR